MSACKIYLYILQLKRWGCSIHFTAGILHVCDVTKEAHRNTLIFKADFIDRIYVTLETKIKTTKPNVYSYIIM